MWRLLHLAAIAGLVGSAVYAYSIKYETIYYAEQIAKVNAKIAAEHDSIAMLRADWAHLTRPGRIQALTAGSLDMQPLALNQIVRLSDIPVRAQKVDSISLTLNALAAGPSARTPHDAKTASGTTPPSGATPHRDR